MKIISPCDSAELQNYPNCLSDKRHGKPCTEIETTHRWALFAECCFLVILWSNGLMHMFDKRWKSTGHTGQGNIPRPTRHTLKATHFIVPSNICKETKGKECLRRLGFTDDAGVICEQHWFRPSPTSGSASTALASRGSAGPVGPVCPESVLGASLSKVTCLTAFLRWVMSQCCSTLILPLKLRWPLGPCSKECDFWGFFVFGFGGVFCFHYTQ